MSKRITVFCDLCGKEIKNPPVEGHQLKIEVVRFPDPYNGTENVVKIDAHSDCVRTVLNARHQHVMGNAPGKLTNIEWLYRHPEKLAETLFCPFEDCKYDEVPLDDGEDICYKCLLNWLKEEHNE